MSYAPDRKRTHAAQESGYPNTPAPAMRLQFEKALCAEKDVEVSGRCLGLGHEANDAWISGKARIEKDVNASDWRSKGPPHLSKGLVDNRKRRVEAEETSQTVPCHVSVGKTQKLLL